MAKKTDGRKAKAAKDTPKTPHCPLCALQERLAGQGGESAKHFRRAGLELLLGLKVLIEECLAESGPAAKAEAEPAPRRARRIAVE